MSNATAASEYTKRAAELAKAAAQVKDPKASAELAKRAAEHAKAAQDLSR